MKWISKIAYGTGQMLKDLVAGVISIFCIIFYENCISLSSSQVGGLILCGQIINGLATPLIGYLSDRSLGPTEKSTAGHQSITCEDESVKKDKRLLYRMKRQLWLGSRKSWHLGGCLLIVIAFPLMFGQPEYLVGLPVWAKLLINGMFIICVQVGWAAVQIPHLSIINDLTDQHDERVLLASLRYFFSGIGDMTTLLVTYLFFESEKSSLLLLKSINETDNHMNNSQLFTKSLLTTDTIVENERVTLFNDSINYKLTNVIKQSVVHSEYNITIQDLPIFRNVALIVVGIGVLFTIIFHCGVREGKPKAHQSFTIQSYEITTISCLITSVAVQRINKLLGNYIGSVVGVPFILGFCAIAYFLKSADENLTAIYFSAAILGIGNTINNVRAVVAIATLIGVNQVHTAAFVHGIASLFDRILTGVFIQCIQLCVPQLTYRHIQVYIVGSLAVFGGILATIDNFIYSETLESTNAPCFSCISRRTTSSSFPSPSKFQGDQTFNHVSNDN
ncbi:hypothetical protein Smp_134700 [Schistosoma mansoni]|uniref:hypothetical protein n=1 Tax=Schistosoma mansoni TaxID=6183 RepID=UPI00022DC578|nr:hypothetical protein Smp_134700 [Schistosoma mansoni]|eukprot:XP_018651448.1 hypothetical protein Smp_134700 [Schistosoma mansoni]